MTKSISTIKNPLTVIAIFAGIAEVSGSAVLPFISEANQQTYIWFLMLFPFALITLFFMVLNWNHKVLYAPSDFQDEDNFVNILQKSSASEKLEEFEDQQMEFNEDEPESEEQSPLNSTSSPEIEVSIVHGQSNSSIDDIYSNINHFVTDDEHITTKVEREHRAELLKLAHKQSRNEALLFSKLVINQLEKELNTDIETDVRMEVGPYRYFFDGIARKGQNLTAIETKFLRDMSRPESPSMIKRSIDRLSSLYASLSNEQQEDFSLIVAIITDKHDQRVYDRLKQQYEKLQFPVAIKVYDIDSIIPDAMRKVS